MVERLTRRERDCLALAAAGETNGQIAGHLYLAEQTVRQHLANLYRRLDLKEVGNPRTKAVALWVRNECENPHSS